MTERSAPPWWRRSDLLVTALQVEILLLTLLPQRLTFQPLGAAGSPAAILGMVLFAAWGLSVLTPSIGVSRRCGPLRLALVLVWVSVLISYVVMHHHAMAGDESRSADRYLMMLISFSGVALCCAEGLRNRAEVLRVVRVAVWGVALMSLVGILQFRPGFDVTQYTAHIPMLSSGDYLVTIQARGGFTRPPGTAIHPIEFAVVVGSTIGLAICLAVYDRNRAAWKRWVPLGLIALGVPVSVSRSALLVVAVVMAMFFLATSPWLLKRAAAAGAAFAVVVFAVIPGMLGTFRDLVLAGESDSSIATRTSDYAAVAPFIRESPWVGRGPGTFLPKYRILDNQYLMTLIESGILGLVALVVLFVTIAALGRGAAQRMLGEGDRLLGRMLAAAAMAGAVASASFDSLSFPTFTTAIALWAGLAGAWWGLARDDPMGTDGLAATDPMTATRSAGALRQLDSA